MLLLHITLLKRIINILIKQKKNLSSMNKLNQNKTFRKIFLNLN